MFIPRDGKVVPLHPAQTIKVLKEGNKGQGRDLEEPREHMTEDTAGQEMLINHPSQGCFSFILTPAPGPL